MPEQPKLPEQQPSVPAAPEVQPQAPQPSGPSVPATPPVMPPINPVPGTGAPTPPPDGSSGQGPAIADDVDVIEKEWVDETNKIVNATKQDPYMEERAIEDLQTDYLKKRYGKEVKPGDTTPPTPPVPPEPQQ